MTEHHQFKVEMTCNGCSGAVERAVKRVEGVTQVQCNLNMVDVYGQVSRNQVLEAIKKTGKKVLEH